MKIANKYFKPLSLLLMLALMVVSCTEFKEFESTTYGSGPTITLAEVSVQDSSFTVSVTSSADGHASLILLPGSGNTAPEDPEDLLTGNVSAMEYQSKAVKANEPTEFTFSGLVQYAIYEVLGAANNADGKPSEVSTIGIGTDDTHAPVLTGSEPTPSYDPVLPVGGPVVLVFDEAVMYDDTKDLTFTTFPAGRDILAASVEVDFNVVTVTPADSIRNREYILLSYPEGAFTDYAENLTAELSSYFDPDIGDFGALVGLFWRAEPRDFDTLSISPLQGVQLPAAFDIVLTFAEEVDVEDVVDGDITLAYDNGLDVLTKSVLASEVSAAGNELTITQSYTPKAGELVTLNIPAGIIGVGIGNPNAEITASWEIAHPLQNWLGNYTIAGVSYGSPGDWDEAWTANIASYPADLSMLAITIDVGNGPGEPFLASFDDVAMTITIASGTELGNVYGGGSTLMYVGDFATIDMVSDLVGTIAADGTISVDKVAIYMPQQVPELYWDAFNTTWTPAGKKTVSRVGEGLASKSARIR